MTLAEVLVAAALTASLGAQVVLLMSPADAVVRSEQDAADLQQRQRVLVDVLTDAIVAAADVVPLADGVRVLADDGAGGPTSDRTFRFDRPTRRLMLIDGASTMPFVERIADFSIEVLDATARRVRITAAIDSAATSGQRQPPRVVTFEAAPRAAR